MQLLMLVVAGLLLAFDFQNVLSWWRVRIVAPATQGSDDFTVIVPVYGQPRYFDGRAALLQYQSNVLVAMETTPAAMAAFADELEQEGWIVGRYNLATVNPATLVKRALDDVHTSIAVRLDADTRIVGDLRLGIAAMIASGAELCSVKCEVANLVNIVTKLQNVEYRMAMLGRHIRPWLTSGACFIGKTDALKLLYVNHSLWTPGEDIETGIVAKALKMKVRHCDLVVATEAPDTWRGLFRQRRLWWAGNFRHWTINLDKQLAHRPVMAFYASAGIWSSLYWKWWGLIDWRELPFTVVALWVFYVLMIFVTNFQVRSRWMLVMPLYSLVQGMLMPILGAAYYFPVAYRRGSWGRYLFGYRRRRPVGPGGGSTSPPVRPSPPPGRYGPNVSTNVLLARRDSSG